MNSVALRVQDLDRTDQVLLLLHLAQGRSDSGAASATEIAEQYLNLAITPPARIGNVLLSLEKRGHAAKGRSRGAWMVSPGGRRRLIDLEFEGDLDHLLAEIHKSGSSLMSGVVHPIVPPEMAPPEFLSAVRDFLLEHPFESNVFGMTRFPSSDLEEIDPVSDALDAAREAVAMHGLEFHIASDRAIVDDLWMNVCAHMWASRYGVAFFEDRKGRGVNHNMTIEVGAMLMTGRRCALLKDESIPTMPTDLVGRIYKPVDLGDSDLVRNTVHEWIREDLGFPACGGCEA